METNEIGQVISLSPDDFEVIHDKAFDLMLAAETDYEPKEGLDTPEKGRKELLSPKFIQNFEDGLNAYYEDGGGGFKGNDNNDQINKQVFAMEYESETIDHKKYGINLKIKDAIGNDMK